MHAPKAMLALLIAVLLVPASTTALTFNAPDAPTIPYEGSSSLNFTASATCEEVLTPGTLVGEGTYEREVTIDYPDGVTGSPASLTLEFAGSDCIGAEPSSTIDSEEQNVTVTPGPTAHGMIVLDVELDSDGDNGTVPFIVDYRTGYDFVFDEALFPMTVTKNENGEWEAVEWTADIVVTANAETMVMMSIQTADKTKYGVLSGFFAGKPYLFPEENEDKQRILSADQLENGITHTVNFSYQPTAEDWQEDVATFQTWGHYLPTAEGKTTVPETVTWTFVNGESEPADDCDAETEECESSNFLPGFETGIAIVVLLGAAMIAVRRRQ